MPQPHNKKFLAQKEKEDRQKKIVIIATITVLVIVFGLIVYGMVDRYVLKPHTTIIQIENQSVDANQFDQQIRWQRRNMIEDIKQSLMYFQQLGGSPEIFAYFEQQLTQEVTQLQQPLLIGQTVLQGLTDELIIRIEAEKMGITVDDAQLDREIEEAFGYFPNGTPTPLPTTETKPTATLTSLQKTILPPTATIEEPAAEENQDLAPTNTPITQAAEEQQGTPDPTATPLLVPTEYTEDLYKENFQTFLNDIKSAGITEDTIREIVRMSVIQQKLLDLVTVDVKQTQEHVWARHILVEDQETALEVANKLANGEDFAALAAEYSIDDVNKDNGGDLGWFRRGEMIAAFEDAAFALQIGEISDPVQTDFGWHIIQSLGKDDLLIDPTSFQQLRSQTFSDWMTEKRLEYPPEINQDWVKFVPTEPVLPQDYVSYIQSLTQPQPQLPAEVPQEQPTAEVPQQ